ncbi:Cullin-4 [Cymbomonas tetramitiformis]|uniref:Cullin-4 n=1 Tax=Cymbomonas tetramitiformis TaxID=36881 RepID=A0AAE0GH01_9CHLO|nr:Cullin-4 [Cymbomonas tetramitiformis]
MDPSTSASASNLARKRSCPGQPKKLVIKPFKQKPKLPADFEERTWSKLKSAVAAVHAKNPVNCSMEELYRDVEDLCLHKMASNTYSRLQQECDAHICSRLQDLQDKTSNPEIFLNQMETTWQDHCNQMLTIRSIFLFLDRTYVIQTSGVKSLWDMGLALFRQHLERCFRVPKKVVQGLLLLVEKERQGETVDRSVLKSLLRMFTSLQMYTESFEKPFLAETTAFYGSEGMRYLQQTDLPEYLQHCDMRLQEENERCSQYLDAATRKPLVAVIEQELLARHVKDIIDKGFDALVDASREVDLRRMYTLFARVGQLDALRLALSEYVKKTGKQIIADEEKDAEMVSILLEFKLKLDRVQSDSFFSNESFANSLKDAFENFINFRQNRPAELIAKFIDAKLRMGNKGASEEELESLLDKVLILFRYIQGKDVFEAFYKKDLAKRLLLNKSASIDAEKSMIGKLKSECGSQFTNKLEGMFKDIDLSKDIMLSFRQSAQARSKLPTGMEMTVHVLTTGYWPTYAPMEVNLPQEINAYQEIFKEFYLSKHQGRRLMWQNSLGHCVLKARFKKGPKELSVSLFQISDATAIEEKELKRTLQSLACAKVRVLTKEPKGRNVEDSDTFIFNDDFTEKLFRIKVNQIQMKESLEENQATTESVFQDRQYQIDAAIVRIMKTRKTLSHTLLISEMYNQLKFPVKPPDLKKRIESLIDREYLQRDRGNPQIYEYLA